MFTAEPAQIRRIEKLVDAGRYRSTSEFLREAIDRRLEELDAEALAEQVERYLRAGHAGEDADLVDAQALPEEE